jgi:membrane-bound lytic murein transglycosylase
MLSLEPGNRYTIDLQNFSNGPLISAQNTETSKLKQDLKALGQRFKSVLDTYKTREQTILQKCRELENELAFYKNRDHL